MRILLITDLYPPMIGGVPTTTQELALDLSSRGHHVWVIAPSERARTVRESARNLHIHRFASFEWPAYESLRIALMPVAPLTTLIRQIRPDIIHIHSLLVLGQLGRMLGSSLNIPVIGTNHYLPLNLSATLHASALSKPFNALTNRYIVSFFNRCDVVTAPTVTAVALLKRQGLRPPARVISNGIRLSKFADAKADPELLKTLRLPDDVPLLLHVNRLSKEKRVDVVIEAMRHVTHPAHLVIAGSGPDQPRLMQQARDLHLEDRISFVGHIEGDALARLYTAGSVFLIASEGELQSIATMDAMLSGLPVVAANAVALPELVQDGRNGALFPPGDAVACAAGVNRLLADACLRERMGKASERIIREHDRERILDQWEALYQETLNAARWKKRDARSHRRAARRVARGKRSR